MNVAIFQQFLSGKSPFIAALFSGLFGATTESTGLTHSGNTGIFIALCGFAGAFIASLPKIIAARSNAKLSESQFNSEETRQLIKMLRKQNTDNDQILSLQVAARHSIQGELQAAIWHIALLEDVCRKACLQDLPTHKHPDIAAMMRNLDAQIMKIKGSEHH